MDLEEQLNTVIFPEAVNGGCFGDDVEKFIRFKVMSRPGTPYFCSDTIFGDVLVENTAGLRFEVPVIVKTNSRSSRGGFPSKTFLDAMFHNEVLFYSKIVPSLRKYDEYDILSASFPDFVCGRAIDGQNSEEDLIILKDLRQRDFQPYVARESEKKRGLRATVLDDNHLALISDRLGGFHGLSMAWRREDPADFEEVTAEIKNFDEAELFRKFCSIECKEIFKECLFRGVEPLQREPKYRDRLTDLCATLENAEARFEESAAAAGPLPVVAHGDIHLGNMMFKYGADGTLVDVAFFDFGMIKVCSPAIDLCHVLFDNLPPEMKRDHWSGHLHQYYGALCRQLGDRRPKPSFEEVDLDIRRKGVHAYYIIAACLPASAMRRKGGTGFPEQPDPENLDETELQEAMKTYRRNIRELGGAAVTEILTEIVRLMIDEEFLFER
ncbi:unnamed protein product [Bemisia tabaci]|uniref:CHK kinase-like domain-containing protein n=1 Tax=Bemisia tabaci TaxID=7038 RepID=A0A9P0AHJ4_BEMTA|nr:unnamed protein product [Bemisia tabaci]